jgi:hypothetical protein
MTLAELEEQVFALIERERRDPIGVSEILGSVPGGRQYFDATKAALELARLLPIEAPPARADERILVTSAERFQ